MEREVINLIKVWLLVLVSLVYSYTIGKVTHKGPLRLLFLSPIVSLFLYLPLLLHSTQLSGLTGFCIAWLANFKLLLFSFGKGPLSSDVDKPISLSHFIATSCLPIKTSSQNHLQKVPITNYAIKGLLFVVLLKLYDYTHLLHPNVLLCLYCLHIYLNLELVLAALAAAARACLGLELEPQFHEPYLSSSLQDFWGRRWNLMVTNILRPAVYDPTLRLLVSANVVGRKWAPLPAVMATFVVSALMHELMLFYMGRVRPMWDFGSFFVFHGFCLCVEVVVKKAMGKKFRLPRLVSGVLTTGFVVSTSLWLFLPPLLRIQADVKTLQEISALIAFFRNVTAHTLGYIY